MILYHNENQVYGEQHFKNIYGILIDLELIHLFIQQSKVTEPSIV